LINKDAKQTKAWLNEHCDVVILKSDKSNKTVIMDKHSYFNKMEKLFDDRDKYRVIRTDPTNDNINEYHKFLTSLVNKKYISKQEKTSLTSYGARPPRTYGLIKLHKVDTPMRNIVSNIGSVTQKLSKILNRSLDRLRANNPYDVTNAFDAITKLNRVELGEGLVMVSFDVESMFPNIPLLDTYRIIRKNWDLVEPFTNIKDKNLFIDGLKMCNKQYFLFNNRMYRQLDGIAMGGSLSVNLGGIYMNHLIDLAISSSNVKPQLIMKYVDDILCVIKECDIASLLLALNSVHPNMKFTVEYESNRIINFLDLQIERLDNNFRYKWYQNLHPLTDYLTSSNHPFQMKQNVASNFMNSVLRLSNPVFLGGFTAGDFQDSARQRIP